MANHPLVFPLISPALVGREAQLAAADRVLQSVADAKPGPRLLLISGEAGVGKSRLLAALAERAGRAGWRRLASACFEQSQALPYTPLADLLRASLDATAGAGQGEEARALLAELVAAAPALSAEGARPPWGAAHEQRGRLLALAAWFARCAGAGPLLLTIEDLHWGDAASLAFLPALARALAGRPALLVATARSDEAASAVRASFGELYRQRLAAEIALPRLSRDEAAAMVRACLGLGRPVRGEFLSAVYAMTDGNPFFIEEVLTALVASGALPADSEEWDRQPPGPLHIPQSIQEVVQQRAAALSPAAREVLTLAAVLGRRFDVALLHAVTGHDEATLVGVLKELVAAQFLVEDAPDLFAFRHALERAAVYRSLLALERRLLHRRVAEVLSRAEVATSVADLALHFAEAQVWDRALAYAQAAAAAAWHAAAPAEVVSHLSAALAAARHLPDTPRAPLLHERGRAYALLDDFAAARADYEAALADARARRHRLDEWQALLDLAKLWSSRDYRRVQAYLEQALAAARAMGDPARLAATLNRIGGWQLNLDRPHAARAAHREAYDLFSALGDERGMAETLGPLGLSISLCGDVAESVAHFQRAVRWFEVHGDRQGLIANLIHLSPRVEFDAEARDSTHLGRHSGPVARALQLAREMGWRAGEALALMMQGSHLMGFGEYGRARDSLEQSLAISGEIGHQLWAAHAQANLGRLQLELLRAPEAIAQLEPALERACALHSVLTVRYIARYLVAAYAQEGCFALADEVLGHPLVRGDEEPEPSLAVRSLQLARAELALMRGEPVRALALSDELIESLGPLIVPRLWLVRGEACLALGQHQQARETLGAALAEAQAQGLRPLVWRIQAALAKLAAEERRRDEARELALAAHALVDELARTLGDPALGAAFKERAAAAIPHPVVLTPRQALKHTFDGLTDRELEVARLIAQGLTNRQIARALVLSERTVSTHIGNIYGKLGFVARAQLVRWTIEKGICPP